MKNIERKIYLSLTFLIIFFFVLPIQASTYAGGLNPLTFLQLADWPRAFLPTLMRSQAAPQNPNRPVVNVPHFSGEVAYREAAIFWFGQVTSQSNYADVRIGYNDQELWVNLSVIDRQLWYDPAAGSPLTAYDSASILINTSGPLGTHPGATAYRFDGQLNWFEPRQGYQAAYRGDGAQWQLQPLPFETTTGWRGGAPNDNTEDDRGWVITFDIPFNSLGLSGPPAEGQTWGLAVSLYDRDSDPPGTQVQLWPSGALTDQPQSWGQLHFGLREYTPPPSTYEGTTTIRQGLNGQTVVDGEVGGGTICGEGMDFWTRWGSTPAPGGVNNTDFNIQNQADIADWPCFAKYYIIIPLDSLPAGKVIQSASLTLHQMGSSGGGDWGTPQPSLIQIMTVAQSWDEASLTWNNAPQAQENVSSLWVNPVGAFPGWPGIPWTWDVSRAAAQAYAAGQPLRLVFYTADDQYHSGKYFVSSDTADWNAEARPTLEIRWGED